MVYEVWFSFIYKGCMMVISTYTKPDLWIFKYFTCISKWSHRIVTYHIADSSISRISLFMRAHKVWTITVIIFITIFENTGILEHTWSINFFCLTINADHIFAKFCNSCCFWIVLLTIWYTTAEVDICTSIIIYKYCRIEAPFNTFTPRCFFCQ